MRHRSGPDARRFERAFMWAVIPVKPFAYAKQRLAPLLDGSERRALAEAMLDDLLDTLLGTPVIERVLIVGSRDTLAELPARSGCERLVEEGRGLSRAVAQAAATLAQEGHSHMLMLPGDIPLAAASEVTALVTAAAASPRRVVMVPDREGYGTNALALPLPAGFPFLFGRESFAAHSEAARAVGLEVEGMELPGISLDIDLPEDLRDLLSFEAPARTLRWLHGQGIPQRLLPQVRGQSAW